MKPGKRYSGLEEDVFSRYARRILGIRRGLAAWVKAHWNRKQRQLWRCERRKEEA